MDYIVKITTIIIILLIIYKALQYGSKGLIHIISLCAVVIALSPASFGSTKAEKSLSKRDLSLDFYGDSKSSANFNKIVHERILRTAIMAQKPNISLIAVNFGRRLALGS